MHNTEDKAWWVLEGARLEQKFVENVSPKIGLKAIINPDKEKDPFAPDLLVDADQKLADLKTQNTPFFKAKELYGLDPQYTVTFNKKDYQRYTEKYKGITIIFWVCWTDVSKKISDITYTVQPMVGVWRCTLEDVEGFVNEGAPLHEYQRRKEDKDGNARDSYLFDLRNMKQLWP